MDRKNARTAGRSALAQSCVRVERVEFIENAGKKKQIPRRYAPRNDKSLEALKSKWNADGFDDFSQRRFRRFRFSLQRSVTRASYDAMRKDGDGKLFEIVGYAIIAAVEKGTSL